MLLSGVDNGPNTGTAVPHSGTVGATLTGATHGVPGVAVSLVGAADWTAEHAWDTAEVVTRRALRWMLAHHRGPTVVNVNVPDVPQERLRGLRPARLAASGAVQADVGETGEGYVVLTFSEVPDEPGPGMDVSRLREGWATVSLLRAPCEVADGDLAGLARA